MEIINKDYILNDNIIKFEIKNKSTEIVSNQYQDNPFPNYNYLEDKLSLNTQGNSNNFTRELKNFLGYNKILLEAGSGTCQLSNFLSISSNNKIFALDATLKSLELGKNFAKNNNINNVVFVKGDILEVDEIFKNEVFDFVYCSGVLHHTKDPYKGFQNLTKCLKNNGYIVIGLYNRYGRLRTFVRQFIYKFINKKIALTLDPVLRQINDSSSEKYKSWIKDQYEHPIESSHTYDEVLKWFKNNNIDYINLYPNFLLYDDNDNYFNKKNKSNFIERICEQIFMIFTKIGSEGGLFLVIGKKVNK